MGAPPRHMGSTLRHASGRPRLTSSACPQCMLHTKHGASSSLHEAGPASNTGLHMRGATQWLPLPARQLFWQAAKGACQGSRHSAVCAGATKALLTASRVCQEGA